MDFLQFISSSVSSSVLIGIGGTAIGVVGTILGYWVRHRMSLHNLQFGNLHTQKITLYPQLIDFVDKTISALETSILKEEKISKKDIDKAYEMLTSFTSKSNVLLIANKSLAEAISSFNFKSGTLFGKLHIYVYFAEKGLHEGLRFEPLKLDLEELKLVRKKMFNLIRKEIGSGTVY